LGRRPLLGKPTDHCTRRLDPESGEHFWLKNLDKVERRGFDLARTLMLDDSPEKVGRHCGNHLRILPFTGSLPDSELNDVLPVLEWLRDVKNVRTDEKRDWRVRFTRLQS
jgi:carboxy-terminal domain RNA polymerase II polypeptide A small phosphatase